MSSAHRKPTGSDIPGTIVLPIKERQSDFAHWMSNLCWLCRVEPRFKDSSFCEKCVEELQQSENELDRGNYITLDELVRELKREVKDIFQQKVAKE